jgi:hypothetical protein
MLINLTRRVLTILATELGTVNIMTLNAIDIV